MSARGFWHTFWLTRLSKPAGERVIHRHVLRTRPARILELGLGLLVRTERMLTAVGTQHPAGPVQYVGLDRFEGRAPSDPPGVSLKQAHRRLHPLGRVQLVPGNTDTSLSRLCNHLGSFDLVLVSADNDERHLERSWFFLQRMIHAGTVVFVESKSAAGSTWTLTSKARIDELAARMVKPGLRRAG
jgi:hypothetical protein